MNLMILTLLLSFSPTDADLNTLWEKGNKAYTDGRFEEALAHYETLLEKGISSGKLHYNVGNAYFMNNQLGRAILHYSRARQLMPTNEDVAANLALADSMRKDPPIEGEDEAFAQTFDTFARSLSYNWIFRLGLIFLVIGGLASLALIARPKTGKWLGYVLVIGCTVGLLFSGAAVLQYKQMTRADMAVLIADDVDVHAGPSLNMNVSFTINQGIRCRILDEAEGWYRIGLANGFNGWVVRTSLEKI